MRKLRNKEVFIKKIDQLVQDNNISTRKIKKGDREIYILYMKEITEKSKLTDDIIKPILQYEREELISIGQLSESVIYIDNIVIDNQLDKMIDYILKGNTIIAIGDESNYVVANTLKVESRNVSTPELQTSIKGPRDSFTENFQTNLSLIRYRIKDPSLKMDNFTIGRRSKTSVAVVYMEDIANQDKVKEIKSRLQEITVDGVFESGYIQKFVRKDLYNLFPKIGIEERSDATCANIIKGKICIIVEGSNLALILPQTFIEFLDAGDDHYENIPVAVFYKSIRFIALVITLISSALYVAIVGFHSDILPPEYILSLAFSRVTVPANALVEAAVMEFIAEMLREASIRLPKQIGPAIGIVGTIVIGQAAVAAGLVSPLIVIIVSLVTMSSFIAPDFTIMGPVRILKFVIIFITGIFGLFGFIMGLTIIAIHLTSMTSFGTPYLAPITPFMFKDLKNYFLSDIKLSKKRPKRLKDQDDTRQ